MSPPNSNILRSYIPYLALVGLILLGLWYRPQLPWDLWWLDSHLRGLRSHRPPASSQIVHLDISDDDRSLWGQTKEEYDGLARLIRLSRDHGAAVVGLDLLLERGRDEDFRQIWGEMEQEGLVLAGTWSHRSRTPPGCRATLGLVQVPSKDEGVLRRYELAWARPPGRGRPGDPGAAPSLALAMYLTLRGQSFEAPMLQPPWVVWTDADSEGNPISRRLPREFYFDQRADWDEQTQGNLQHLTPRQLEDWERDPQSSGAELAGKAVLIGYTGSGAGDMGSTSISNNIPRIAVHGWALNDLLQDSWRQTTPTEFQLLAAALLLLSGWALAWRWSGWRLLILWLLGALAIEAGCAWSLLKTHYLWPAATLGLIWSAAVGLESYRRRQLLDQRLAGLMESEDPMVGRIVGGYRLVERLGQGGFAAVYRGLDRQTMEPSSAVAIKVIHPAWAQDEGFRRRFLREVRITSQLQHPNVVRVLKSGEENGLLFLAMELLPGRSLRYYLEQFGPWPVDQVLLVLRSLLEGMAYAHQHKVLHRDLKPENVMIGLESASTPSSNTEAVPLLESLLPADTQAVWAESTESLLPKFRVVITKIVDFGLAFDNQSSQITQSNELLGTFNYLAPERLQGHPDDPRSDQYALGVIAYELLSGRGPYPVYPTVAEGLIARLSTDPMPLSQARPGLPEDLLDLINRMLIREPRERFATMEEALAELGRVKAT